MMTSLDWSHGRSVRTLPHVTSSSASSNVDNACGNIHYGLAGYFVLGVYGVSDKRKVSCGISRKNEAIVRYNWTRKASTCHDNPHKRVAQQSACRLPGQSDGLQKIPVLGHYIRCAAEMQALLTRLANCSIFPSFVSA